MEPALAAAATVIAVAFALSTLDRWIVGRARHELAWTISLTLFAIGSAALWVGAAIGWSPLTFRVFYLAGAVLNVPFLALGTVYLLGDRRHGDLAFGVLAVLAGVCSGWILAAPTIGPIDPDVLPRGKEVFGPGPRVMAAVGSGAGALVLFAGAATSAFRLVRRAGSRRLAAANGSIAAGTLVLSAGGLLNSVVGEMEAFALTLVVGISLIFGGFLLTNRTRPPAVAAWLRHALEEPLEPATPPSGSAPAEHLTALSGPRQN